VDDDGGAPWNFSGLQDCMIVDRRESIRACRGSADPARSDKVAELTRGAGARKVRAKYA